MSKIIKNNLNLIISIFLLLNPILDIVTGIYNISIISFVIRTIFLIGIYMISIFVYHKKQFLLLTIPLLIYYVLFIIGKSSFLTETLNFIKTFYYPFLLIVLYSLRPYIRISKHILITPVIIYTLYVLCLSANFLPVSKESFSIANGILGLIMVLTPTIWTLLGETKSSFSRVLVGILLMVLYGVLIYLVGNKLLVFVLSVIIIVYLVDLWYKRKKNPTFLLSLIILLGILLLGMTIPKTSRKTPFNFLDIHERMNLLQEKANDYKEASIYHKLFGLGYAENEWIEMDGFDIYYKHGMFGFLLYIVTIFAVIYKILDEKEKSSYEYNMTHLSVLLTILLSLLLGHILTSPSVSLVVLFLLVSLAKKQKRLLFTSYNLDMGGIEKALLNLVNRIDSNKYEITVILEKKEGIFLNRVNPNVIVKELKVSNNTNIILRKVINVLRKSIFKLFNYHTYDFSCCYATHSYSSSKLALMASSNTAIYVHSDFRVVYPKEEDFYYFFDSRRIRDYRNIIFVSNENKEGFVELYDDLKDRCKVFNNFIDTAEIIEQSKEKITAKKSKGKELLVFVGRLDDSSKKISRQIHLVDKISSLELWIIGDGPDREKYEEEVKEKKLEKRITFFGKKENPFPYMKQADYVILTSDYEGFPVTYLEAIVLNKNIITTFPTSDDTLDVAKYGTIISKEHTKMVKEVKELLKNPKKSSKIDLEASQKIRMKELEKIFDEVI